MTDSFEFNEFFEFNEKKRVPQGARIKKDLTNAKSFFMRDSSFLDFDFLILFV